MGVLGRQWEDDPNAYSKENPRLEEIKEEMRRDQMERVAVHNARKRHPAGKK